VEGAALGRSGLGRPEVGVAAPGATTAAGEGCARAWARERERRRLRHHRRGGGKGHHRGGKTEGGGAPPPRKVRREWERLCTDGKRRNPRCNNGGFSPGKKTLAGAEKKFVDCRRFGDPIDEPNALRRSPRRDERSGTHGFRRRCTDWE
jgi:hypothetical protein